MMTITVTPATLSSEERVYIADFIRNFPADSVETTIIPSFTVPREDEPESDDITEAEAAFSNLVTMPAAPPADNERLDKSGLPWDERIHTSSHAKNADGTWRRKRGVAETLVAEVETQLRALMAVPAGIPIPPAPVAAAEPATPAAPVVVVPPPPAPVAAATDQTTTYIGLIQRASELMLAQKLTQVQLDTAIQSVGVPSLPLLANRLDLVAQVMASINAAAAA